MVQFQILSGKTAGSTWMARRFPVRIGRSISADLQSTDEGVWEDHVQLDLRSQDGFVLTVGPGAFATVNEEHVERAVLRNGDIIGLGSLKLQFWLGEIRQTSLRFREMLTWLGIASISLVQVFLIYWLMR